MKSKLDRLERLAVMRSPKHKPTRTVYLIDGHYYTRTPWGVNDWNGKKYRTVATIRDSVIHFTRDWRAG